MRLHPFSHSHAGVRVRRAVFLDASRRMSSRTPSANWLGRVWLVDGKNTLSKKKGWLVVSQVGCKGPRDADEAEGLRVEQFDAQVDAFKRSAEVNKTPKEVDDPAKPTAVLALPGARPPQRGLTHPGEKWEE